MEKKWSIFVVQRLHFSNILDLIWTWTSHLKNILDCGWTWTEFLKIRTGSGSQIMTVRSSLLWGKMCDTYIKESFLTAIPESSRRDIQPCIVSSVEFSNIQLSKWFRIWIGCWSWLFLIFRYGLDMELIKSFGLDQDDKISTSVHHWWPALFSNPNPKTLFSSRTFFQWMRGSVVGVTSLENVQVCTFHDGCKQGIDQQIFNRKSISRKITHPQSWKLQAKLTGEKLKGCCNSREKTNSRLQLKYRNTSS